METTDLFLRGWLVMVKERQARRDDEPRSIYIATLKTRDQLIELPCSSPDIGRKLADLPEFASVELRLRARRDGHLGNTYRLTVTGIAMAIADGVVQVSADALPPPDHGPAGKGGKR